MSFDSSTTYLGLRLSNPIVASAGPATGHRDSLAKLAEAGVGAVVLPSLFEEEVAGVARETNAMLTQGADVFAEAQSYLPEPRRPLTRLDDALELVADAKERLGAPVIASVNGTTPGGWITYARDLVDAGADAVELNVYLVAADPGESATDVEARYLDVVRAVRDAIDVPLAVKLSPYFTALTYFAREVVDAGADGLVCFNRFYQPDIDLTGLDVVPRLQLSTAAELRLPLRWIAILRGRIGASLALSTGVFDPTDAVKAILAGADAVMTTSALIANGPSHIETLRVGVERWFAEREYDSIAQAVGSVSQEGVADPDAFERSNYVASIRSWSNALRV